MLPLCLAGRLAGTQNTLLSEVLSLYGRKNVNKLLTVSMETRQGTRVGVAVETYRALEYTVQPAY